jgi:NADH:ubiquinone oxidoreductase subunit E
MKDVLGKTACSETASASELMARLDETLAEYQGKPGALIPVLQIAQGIFGYLPEKAMKRIALKLGKSYSEVAGVVGFYSFFSTVPRGKHLIRVCMGTACYVRGGKQVLEACRQELGIDVGGTTDDRLFSLEVARCFGACGLAPTIMIDEEVYQRVKPLKLRVIFDSYRNGGPRPSAKKAESGKAEAKKPAAKAAKPSAKRAAGRSAKPVAAMHAAAVKHAASARRPMPARRPVRPAAKRAKERMVVR